MAKNLETEPWKSRATKWKTNLDIPEWLATSQYFEKFCEQMRKLGEENGEDKLKNFCEVEDYSLHVMKKQKRAYI